MNMEMEQLIQSIRAVSSSNLTEFKYEENGVEIGMKKEQAAVIVTENAVQPKVAVERVYSEETVSEEETELSGNIVKSLLVGTFYAAPSEDAAPFVCVGDTVKKGQTLAIVEAMKLMNEIECEFDGIVAEVYVENGQAVEYGQPLFRIQLQETVTGCILKSEGERNEKFKYKRNSGNYSAQTPVFISGLY